MNRHDRRKAAKLKGKPTLISIAAFYKAMADDGFNFGVTKSETDINFLHTKIEELQKHMDADTEFTSDMVKDQLHELIRDYNMKAFGTTVRPMGQTKGIELTGELMSTVLLIMANIRYLERHGVIVGDEWNGMHYGYAR